MREQLWIVVCNFDNVSEKSNGGTHRRVYRSEHGAKMNLAKVSVFAKDARIIRGRVDWEEEF